MSSVYVKNSNSAKGVGFTGLLTIVFIVLKLCKIISWSWIWVLSPMWISFLLIILVFFLFLGIEIWKEKN